MKTFIIILAFLFSFSFSKNQSLSVLHSPTRRQNEGYTLGQDTLRLTEEHDQQQSNVKNQQYNQQNTFSQVGSTNEDDASSTFNSFQYQYESANNQQSLKSVGRILQGPTSTSNTFIKAFSTLFEWVLPLSRNLLLIGLLTNTLDIFLPYILLSEGFLMIGLWGCQKHYMTTLYTSVFSSYCDLLNAVRLIVQPQSTPNLIQLSQYGLSSILVVNLAGEILIALLLLSFTVLANGTNLFNKSEYLQKMGNNLRALWNSYFFAVLPRVATFAGFHLRDFGHVVGIDVINGLTCSIFLLLLPLFFVLLLVQTRQVANGESEQKQLGLAGRIDRKALFSLDCLSWSSLYLHIIIYLRLILYFLPIGLIWDCNELSFGGPLVSQLLMVMIQINSPCYILLRDKIIFPLLNFFLFLVQLCLITVGLAESAPYSPLSERLEIVLLCLLFITICLSLGSTGADCWREAKQKWSQGVERKRIRDATTHKLMTQTNKTAQIKKTELQEQATNEASDEKTRPYPNSFRKHAEHLTQNRKKRAKVRIQINGLIQ